ncbi:hypothetical protein [Flavobacterium sp.]|uniref:hypothetical protein n=1 Tax=Flavobacterium sp. TaxID=239 RepID=UPI00262B3DD5|nr:hypothetical protein [Flavobacterium sp.]
MRKFLLLFFFISFFQMQGQVKKVIKHTNDAGDVTSYELDCSQNFPILAKGLRYTITRHEFKDANPKNVYRILMVMDGFYTNVLNSEMSISAELSDGTITTQKQTIENDGYFDGACTLKMDLIKAPVKLSIKKIILHAGKEVVYLIPENNAKMFTQNLNAIFAAK